MGELVRASFRFGRAGRVRSRRAARALVPWVSLLAISLAAAWPSRCAAQIKVTADFEGGAAEVVAIDDAAKSIHLTPTPRQDRGWPCWWYCRVDGLTPGAAITLRVGAAPAPFRERRVLDAAWALPDQAALSDDNVVWRRTAQGRRVGNTTTYAFTASAATMWLAWGPPFLASHADALLARVKASVPGAEVFELARSRQDRPVRAVRFGAAAEGDAKPFGVWVQARQHAWEAGSSWVGQGFVAWAASDDPQAVELRRRATIYFVPIMDVDNVALGAGGKEAVPRDHNRDWSDEPVYPEVRAAQRELLRLDREGRLDVFLDLHNPGAGDRKPFFFGPQLEELPALQRRNYLRFVAIAHERVEHCEAAYRFASYVPTAEERSRVSANWVREHTAPHVLSTTLETAWNRPQGTAEGYETVGRQLAQTVARYVALDPRAE